MKKKKIGVGPPKRKHWSNNLVIFPKKKRVLSWYTIAIEWNS